MSKKLKACLFAFVFFVSAASYVRAGDNSDWNGLYAGAGYGGASLYPAMQTTTAYSATGYFQANDVQAINALGVTKMQESAMSYSAHAGYTLGLGDPLVVGIQADFGAMSIKTGGGGTGTYASNTNSFSVGEGVVTSWTGTIRPKIGVDLGGVWLYGTGGLAFTEVSYQSQFADSTGLYEIGGNDQFVNNGGNSSILAGLVLGFGGEFKLAGDLSLDAEYLFMDFGTVSQTSNNLTNNFGTTPYPTQIFTTSFNLTTNAFNLGLNYRL